MSMIFKLNFQWNIVQYRIQCQVNEAMNDIGQIREKRRQKKNNNNDIKWACTLKYKIRWYNNETGHDT